MPQLFLWDTQDWRPCAQDRSESRPGFYWLHRTEGRPEFHAVWCSVSCVCACCLSTDAVAGDEGTSAEVRFLDTCHSSG